MKKTVFDFELSWTDPNGICHNLLVDRLHLLPGDRVDCHLKFTVLGDELQPIFEPLGEKSAQLPS